MDQRGWAFAAVTGGLSIAAIFQTLNATTRVCFQPETANGLLQFSCPGAGPEFLRGIICAVLAGATFFSGLACFYWAAHLRTMQLMTQIHQSGFTNEFVAQTGASLSDDQQTRL